MKILISPAKLMTLDKKTDFLKPTTPKFIDFSNKIQESLKQKDPKFIKNLMKISDKLAMENWDRNQNWKSNPSQDESNEALYAFTGEVYRGLDASSLDKSSVDYLQNHLRILSGLYGMLKPSDKVMLYRLEMGCPFSFENHKNLYQFWSEKVTEELNNQLKKDDFILNLASNEYSKVINRKQLKSPLINFNFHENREDKLKTIVVYTKHARGLVTRFCAENKINNIEDVKAFNLEGYLFRDDISTSTNFVFAR